MRLSKRDGIGLGKNILIRAVAVLLSLIVSAFVIFIIVKLNPLKVYVSMFNGSFGTEKRIWLLLRDMMVLACIAIGLAPAFKMRFWNIGAEGQMLVGGIAAVFFMRNYATALPTPVLFLCMVLGALLFGCIWGLIPGFF